MLVLTALSVSAKTNSTLESVVKKYRNAGIVFMNIEKVVKSELLGSETTFSGKMVISKGLFRLETETPEKTLLVYDGETIWNEQSPPAEFKGAVQVAKAKLDRKNKSQVLVSTLLSKGELNENFTVSEPKKSETGTSFVLTAKDKNANLSQVELKVDEKKKIVTEIIYNDDVGNRTAIAFSKIEFKKKTKKNENLFKYTPPKGAQISNL